MQNQISRTWPKNKLSEIDAVKHYVENTGKTFNENLLNISPLEPVDIEYTGMNFQVVKADFEFQKMIGQAKQKNSNYIGSRKRRRDQIWEDFVLESLRKKNLYGKSANDVVLLIYLYFEPPWIDTDLRVAREMDSFINQLKTFGFDEIYLVLPKKNIQIFP